MGNMTSAAGVFCDVGPDGTPRCLTRHTPRVAEPLHVRLVDRQQFHEVLSSDVPECRQPLAAVAALACRCLSPPAT